MRVVHGIPNQAWTFWSQGISNLDPIVKLCIRSWETYGEFDKITLLDSESVFEYLSPRTLPSTFLSLPVQIQSDLVRLALLRDHGGIWMDASSLVTAPVADWLQTLELHAQSFLFQNPGKGVGGRLFETGFMASSPNHEFFSDWFALMFSLFSRPRVHRAHSPSSEAPVLSKKAFALMNKYLRQSPAASALWAVPPLAWLPFYPFFIVHYVGNSLLRRPKHESLLKEIELVEATKYLRIREVSNEQGWLVALRDSALFESPVHDVEFRKPMSKYEVLGLAKFTEGQRYV